MRSKRLPLTIAALSLTLFCAGCNDDLKALARNVPPMPATCVKPSPAPYIKAGASWKSGFFAYARAFRAVNREKVECGLFADKVLGEVRSGRR